MAIPLNSVHSVQRVGTSQYHAVVLFSTELDADIHYQPFTVMRLKCAYESQGILI